MGVSVLAAVVVAALGYVGWQRDAAVPVAVPLAAPEAVAAPLAAPEAVASEAEGQPGVAQATPEPATGAVAAVDPAVADPPAALDAPLTAPEFDNWRVDADGAAVVAGRAPAGAEVAVMVDGAEVARVTATALGEFAALFTLPPKDSPRLMRLEAVMPDGKRLASAQTVAIAPIVPPVVVAAAEPLVGPSVAVADDSAVAPETVSEPVASPTAAPAAVMITDAGGTVLQPGAAEDPGVASNVTLDAITYTPSGAVQLGGRGQAGAFVRIYLDGAAIATSLVPDSGDWLTTLPDTAPGIYTLRVDQVDEAGRVTSRFETPFKRETLEALAAVASPEATVDEVASAEPTAPVVIAEGNASLVPPDGAATDGVAPDGVTTDGVTTDGATTDGATTDGATTDEAATDVAATDGAATDGAASDSPAPVVTATQDPAIAPVPAVESATQAPAADGPVVAVAVAAPEAPSVEAQPAPAPVSITVQPGFTLWGIARENFGDGVLYVQVFEANKDKIRNPDLIYPGQVFTIPQPE